MNLLLAMALPLLLGALCIDRLMPAAMPGRAALVCGNGMLLGLLVLPLLMRLLDGLGVVLSFFAISFAAGTVILVLLLLARVRRGPLPPGDSVPTADFYRLPWAHKALCIFLALLIVVHISTAGLELLWRPLFPWDATMHWATKARVWFENGSLVPFVENRQWLKMGGEGVFTDHHPGYPITTPLLQLWFSLSLGRWDESLMNLPWLLCYIGLAAAFYGQARAAGSTILAAMVFTYMLVSMPLLATHVALAGYADLFLGACYCAAIMAMHNWSVTRQRGQAIAAVVFALFCPLIKNEGFYWLLTFVPALMVVLLPLRRTAVLAAAGLAMLALVLILFPPDLVVAGHSLSELKPRYHPRAVAGVASSIWLQDNWHLLGYLLLALLPPVVLLRKSAVRNLAAVATAILAAVLLLLVLFLATKYSHGAVYFTAVGRISLHLAPSLMFLALLLWNEVSGRAHVPAGLR